MRNTWKYFMALTGALLILGGGFAVRAQEEMEPPRHPPAAEAGRPDGQPHGKMDASFYDKIARSADAPIYDYYAKQIKEKTGITKGVCIDLGSGGGYLGLALARITDLDFIFLDISAEMLEKAKMHIVEDGLQKRAKTMLADVHHIPLPDGSVNLAISRGSIPFWTDAAQAFREVRRILAPGGTAYLLACGRGTPEMQKQMEVRMKEEMHHGPGHEGPGKPEDWFKEHFRKVTERDYEGLLKAAGIARYVVTRADDGVWVQIWKEERPPKGEKRP